MVTFDTINHYVLVQKLYAICLSKHTASWYKSYLSNRSFLVNLRNKCSQHKDITKIENQLNEGFCYILYM